MDLSKSIMKKLRHEDLSSALDDIEEFFKITKSKIEFQCVYNILRTLYQSLSTEKSSNSPLILLPSINLCVDYIEKHYMLNSEQKLQFLRLLYHICSVYLKCDLCLAALSYAENISSLLCEESIAEREVYIQNFTTLFWNKGLQIEKKDNTNSSTVFKLRCAAIRFMLIGENYRTAPEKILPTILKYYKNTQNIDSTEVENFVEHVWQCTCKRQSDLEHCFFQFKLLFSVCEVLTKCFKDSRLYESLSQWLSEVSKLVKKLGNTEYQTCVDIANVSVRIFFKKECVNVKSYASCLKRFSEYSHSDFSMYAFFFFYTIFISALNSQTSDEEEYLSIVMSHIDLCSSMIQLYLKVSSNEKEQKPSLFTVNKEICLSHTFTKCVSSIIKKEKNAEDIPNQVVTAEKFVQFSIDILKSMTITTEIWNNYKNYALSIGNIGSVLYNSGSFSASSNFFEACCDLLSRPSSIDKDDIQKMLWERMEILFYSQLRSGERSRALQTVVRLMMTFKDRRKDCIKLWQMVKRDALRSLDKSSLSKTISDTLPEMNLLLSSEEEISLLCIELKSCKFERNHNVEEILSIANKLFSLPSSPVQKACVVLEILNMSGSVYERFSSERNKSLIELCSESVKTYEEYVSKYPSDHDIKLHLSVGYFWLYQMKMMKLREVAEKESENCFALPLAEEKTGDPNDLCDVSPAFPLLNTLVEAEMIRCLESALEIWMSLPTEAWSKLKEQVKDLDLLSIVNCTAEVFSTSMKELSELKAWTFLRTVACILGDKDYELTALTSLINFAIRMGYFTTAEELISHVEASAPVTDSSPSSKSALLRLKFELAVANYNLQMGNFDEGLKLLKSIWEGHALLKKSKCSSLFQAEVLMLQSKYLSVSPLAFKGEDNLYHVQMKTSTSSVMESAAIGKKLHDFEAESQDAFDVECVTFKPLLLKHLLVSYLDLSQLYFNVGDHRFARCYLKEGLKVAGANILTYWSARMLILLGQVDLFCDDLKDCIVKLNGLKYIMAETNTQNIQMLLSQVFDATKSLESPIGERRHSSENLNSPDSFVISETISVGLKREIQQNFFESSEHFGSPVPRKERTFDFEVKSTVTQFSMNLLSLEMWGLICSHLIAENKLSVASGQLKKLLCAYEDLQNAYDGTKNGKQKNLIFQTLKATKLASKKTIRICTLNEVSFAVSVLLKLSDLVSSEEGKTYMNRAFDMLNGFSRCSKYLCSDIYSLFVYQKIVKSLRDIAEIPPTSCVEFTVCPSMRACFRSATKAKLIVPQLNTPTKGTPPKIIVTSHKPRKGCNAPVKRDVLPPHFKKDIEDNEKLRSPLIFSSSDDDNDSLFLKAPQGSSKKDPPPSKKELPFKVFKSKNASLDIQSSSDVWKCPDISTTPRRKRLYKQEGMLSPSKLKKTYFIRSKSLLTPSVSPQPMRKTRQLQNTKKVAIYSDSTECFQRRVKKPSIERYEESRENARSTSISGYADDNVFGSPSVASMIDDLCNDINSMGIASEVERSGIEKCLLIPEENLKIFNKDLDEVRSLIQHTTPYPIYVNICKLQGIIKMIEVIKAESKAKLNTSEVGFLLSETVAVTLRQICLNYKLFSKKNASNDFEHLTSKPADLSLSSQMTSILDKIPRDYTVIQISVLFEKENISSPHESNSAKLIISRYRNASAPVVMAIETEKMNFLSELETIMKESTLVMKTSNDTMKWWKTRQYLDNQLKGLLTNMEDTLLGSWKGLLLSQMTNGRRKKQISDLINKIFTIAPLEDRTLLQMFLDSASVLTRDQVSFAVSQLWNRPSSNDVHSKLCKLIQDGGRKLSLTERSPLILILDKTLQSLPWENLPILSGIPVSRMPSLSLLASKLSSSRLTKGIDCSNTFYILNPSGDLKYTQEFFQTRFESQTNWTGITGRKPSSVECTTAFKNYDLFIYCGHNSGSQYLEGTIDKLKCNASTMLMGCSSGRLKRSGKLMEAYGYPLMYLMNGCPCVVGNLWDVTDKDTDRFTDKLFELFIPNYNPEKSVTTIDIAKAVSQARKACKMTYLVGAAPVVYGLPISADRGESGSPTEV